MPTITRLEAANRRASRTIIDLDGEPWAEIDTEVVLRHRLAKEVCLGPEQAAALLAEDAFVRSRRAAAVLLHVRGRSIAELRRKLRERGHDEISIERTIQYFAAKGDLDDRAFAQAYAQRLLTTRCVGPEKARYQLRRLGVGEADVRAALAGAAASDPAHQRRQARGLLERRLRNPRQLSPARLRENLRQSLRRAGFDADLCQELVDEAMRKYLAMRGEDEETVRVEEREEHEIPPRLGRKPPRARLRKRISRDETE
jgi:SOS response regulatory protein OraA/RecX